MNWYDLQPQMNRWKTSRIMRGGQFTIGYVHTRVFTIPANSLDNDTELPAKGTDVSSYNKLRIGGETTIGARVVASDIQWPSGKGGDASLVVTIIQPVKRT